MKQTISNALMTVSACTAGAELCSIQGASGVEYLWQADPSVWPRHAPLLFPVVGKLANDRYTFQDQSYVLPQHGFGRDMSFELEAKTDAQILYRLAATDETRNCYPFEFVLHVKYELSGSRLEVQYTVSNQGHGVMPFSIGAHPGFSLSWGESDAIEDYYLEFSQPETLDTHHLGDDHLLSGETERVLTNERHLPISKDLFQRDALIFIGQQSDSITLRSHKHPNALTVSFPGFPSLGIWAKPAAPFVCIEPWYGHADTSGTDGVIMHKPGILHLAPDAMFTCGYTITVNE
ncbi:MAG: aldose 1-epimerase family protein [Lentisphaerae bacterium]|nr:aldose 1-epimerase family protein [Lentisphaerota bacterium]